MKSKLKHIYEHKYKLLLLIPFIILVLAIVQIGAQYAITGDFVNRGISLKGGSTITADFDSSINIDDLQGFINSKFPKAEISVRTLSSAGQDIAFVIESDAQENNEINALTTVLKEKFPADTEFSVEVMGSALGESFFKQTITALLIAFVLMGIVVFIYFRTLAPSLAVILAAFSDIVVTLAIFNLTGIKLSTAGIAAFLMLIGYSVDTDILLSTRVLKRKEGTLMEKIYGAMKTGLTMNVTTLSAIAVSLFFVQSEIIKQIMIILFIGLLVDIIMTWIQNVGVLRIYLERKRK